jgi:hypothetical protein
MPSLPGGGDPSKDMPGLPDGPDLSPAAAGGGGSGGGSGGGGGGLGSSPLQPAAVGPALGTGPTAGGSAAGPHAAGAPGAAGGMGGMGGGMGGMHGGGGHGQGGKEKKRAPGLTPDEVIYTEDREWTENYIGQQAKRRPSADSKDSK